MKKCEYYESSLNVDNLHYKFNLCLICKGIDSLNLSKDTKSIAMKNYMERRVTPVRVQLNISCSDGWGIAQKLQPSEWSLQLKDYQASPYNIMDYESFVSNI